MVTCDSCKGEMWEVKDRLFGKQLMASTEVRNTLGETVGHVNMKVTDHVKLVIPEKHLGRAFRHAVYF